MDQRGGGLSWRRAAAACVGPDPEARADARRELGGALSGSPPASRRKQTALSVRGARRAGEGRRGGSWHASSVPVWRSGPRQVPGHECGQGMDFRQLRACESAGTWTTAFRGKREKDETPPQGAGVTGRQVPEGLNSSVLFQKAHSCHEQTSLPLDAVPRGSRRGDGGRGGGLRRG